MCADRLFEPPLAPPRLPSRQLKLLVCVDGPCSVKEQYLEKSAGCGVLLNRAGIRLRCLTMESTAIESRSEAQCPGGPP